MLEAGPKTIPKLAVELLEKRMNQIESIQVNNESNRRAFVKHPLQGHIQYATASNKQKRPKIDQRMMHGCTLSRT